MASIAAGKHGICRQAPIAAVLISLAAEDVDRRTTFYDSTHIAHAVEYLLDASYVTGVNLDVAGGYRL